jgi:hypothetical protein
MSVGPKTTPIFEGDILFSSLIAATLKHIEIGANESDLMQMKSREGVTQNGISENSRNVIVIIIIMIIIIIVFLWSI